MVETLRATIDLDVAAARRQIQSLETALDSLATTIAIDVSGDAQTEIRQIDDRLDEAVRSADRLSTEMSDASTQAGQAENNVRELAQALGISEDRAAALASEFVEAQAAANRTEAAARDIARQLGLADSEADQFVASLRRADAAAENINVTSRGMVGTFGLLKTSIGGIATVLATIGVGQGIAAAARGAHAAVTEFARLNESVNAVKVIFDEGAAAIFDFGETATRSVLLSKQAFQEAVVPIGSVLRNFGFDARDAAGASIELIQRAADLASVLNTDVDQALLAINAALVGQVEPLRRYGGEISAARVEQFAFAAGLAKTKADLDQNVIVQARLGLILKDTSFAAGDVARTIDDYANANRSAKAETQEFSADIGEALLPAFEGLLNIVPDVIEGLRFLIPVFEDAGDAAHDFFNELDPEGAAGGGTPFAGITAGIANFGAVFGVFTSGIDLIRLGIHGLTLDSEEVGRDLDSIAGRVNQVAIAIGRSAVAHTLTVTGDALQAFATGLTEVGRRSENIDTFSTAFADFGRSLNLSSTDLLFILPQIINEAERLGLSAPEVDFLTDSFTRLRNEVGAIGADRHFMDIPGHIDAVAAAAANAPDSFTTFVNGLEDLPPAIETFAERVDTAMEGVSSALDPFAEAEEPIKLSSKEFFANLTRQIEEDAAFSAGLIRLIQLGFDDVALAIAAEGPRAQSALDSALGNLTLTASSEALLEGEGNQVTDAINRGIIEGLANDAFTIAQQAAFVDLIERGIIDNPEVIAALGRGGTETAATLVDQYAEAMVTEEPAFATATRDSIERAIIDGVSGMSVTELAAALNIPLQQAALAIKLKISPDQIIFPSTGGAPIIVTGGGKQFAGGGISTGGTTFNQTIVTNNPVAVAPATSIQQGAQLAGAVGNLLVGFVS